MSIPTPESSTEVYEVLGVKVRVSDVVPKEIIGVSNGRYLILFWQGAEIARIYDEDVAVTNTPGLM